MSILNYLQDILQVITTESKSLDDMVIDNGKNSGNDNDINFEFIQYAEQVPKISEYSQKSLQILDKITSNENNLKYIVQKLTDYGDLTKRIDRLTSALDELEYKVTNYILSTFNSHLITDSNERF